jgi:hypothetical protein
MAGSVLTLEGAPRGLRERPRAALLGTQDGQRLEQAAKGLRKKAKQHPHDIWMAETRKEAEAAFDFFLAGRR